MNAKKIQAMINRALADGRLSAEESSAIKAAIYADKAVTETEVALFRQLQEKIWLGEVQIDHDP